MPYASPIPCCPGGLKYLTTREIDERLGKDHDWVYDRLRAQECALVHHTNSGQVTRFFRPCIAYALHIEAVSTSQVKEGWFTCNDLALALQIRWEEARKRLRDYDHLRVKMRDGKNREFLYYPRIVWDQFVSRGEATTEAAVAA